MGVIDSVSETLRTVLDNELALLVPPSTAEVSDLLGVISTTPPRVTLFLYEVIEDPSARNRPRTRTDTVSDVTLHKARMALLLRYLLTPWSPDAITDHKLLECTLQTFYDTPIISGPQLQDDLAGTSEALRLTLLPLSLEDKTRIWYSIQQPYRLSVVYEVRVIELDTTVQEQLTPVTRRSAQFNEVGP
jgi:hypothetical protein